MNKSLEMLALQQELDEVKARLAAYNAVMTEPLDNYTIQSCCICYGGNSFPGPIKDALDCYREIVQQRIDERLSPTADIG